MILKDDGTGRHSVRTQAVAQDLLEYPVLHQAFPRLDIPTQLLCIFLIRSHLFQFIRGSCPFI